MKTSATFLAFLTLNIGALFIGVLLMNNGPTSEWYISLERAPWEPPGWVFGAAWTSIMVFFSFYMTFLYQNLKTSKVLLFYLPHFVLNISWNYIFMNKHMVDLGLINIALLTTLMFYFLFGFTKTLGNTRFFALPYCLWLVLATTLNLYIVIYN